MNLFKCEVFRQLINELGYSNTAFYEHFEMTSSWVMMMLCEKYKYQRFTSKPWVSIYSLAVEKLVLSVLASAQLINQHEMQTTACLTNSDFICRFDY